MEPVVEAKDVLKTGLMGHLWCSDIHVSEGKSDAVVYAFDGKYYVGVDLAAPRVAPTHHHGDGSRWDEII